MKVITTWGELNEKAFDFNEVCSELGLNPWAMNEGLADKDDVIVLTEDQAKRFGLL